VVGLCLTPGRNNQRKTYKKNEICNTSYKEPILIMMSYRTYNSSAPFDVKRMIGQNPFIDFREHTVKGTVLQMLKS